MPVGAWAVYLELIVKGEQPVLLPRIAATETVSLSERMKS